MLIEGLVLHHYSILPLLHGSCTESKMEQIHSHFHKVDKFTHYSSRFHPPQRVFLLMWPPIDFAVFIHHEGMEAKLKRKKTKCFSVPNSKTNPTRAGWPKRERLGLIRATQWADFTVITDQLWSTIAAIFSCVALSFQDCSLPLIFVYYCQPQKKPNWISVKLLRAFGHFVSQQRFFVTRIGTILVRFHPLLTTWVKYVKWKMVGEEGRVISTRCISTRVDFDRSGFLGLKHLFAYVLWAEMLSYCID